MDYEHDDRRAADVPGAPGAEGSGLPAGREPLDAGLTSSRSPEVRAFDPHLGSSPDPSDPAGSGQADELFDAMFLTGGLRPPAFAAVDDDLGFRPPQTPDLASAFLAALDAIDDRRFVTPVPDDSLMLSAPVVEQAPAPAAEPAYELRPQSQFELESEAVSESVDETLAAPVAAEEAVEDAIEDEARLPWDTVRMPVAGLLTAGEPIAEAIEEATAAPGDEPAAEVIGDDVNETFEEAFEEPIEEAAYYAAGIDGDAGEADELEAAAVVAAEAEAETDEVMAAAAQADADQEEAAAAADAEAVAEAEALALALAEAEAQAAAERAELDAAIAAEAALHETALQEAALDDPLIGVLDDPFAAEVAPVAGVTAGDDDLELEPSIGMEPMDVAPMTFDGPDAFAAAPVVAAAPEPEPEPESDVLEDLQDYVVFSLGDMRCVVPIRNVVEVGRIPDAAPVPNAPVWLYGLGNLRGQVLSLIDLRAFFGVGRIKAAAGRMVVLRGDSDDITAGVMVDQVHQIVALSPSRFKEAPATLPLPEKTTEFVWGACDYGNYTMIGLDVDGVLGVENLTEEAV